MKSQTLQAIRYNSQYYLVDVTVYADGSIHCWETMNLESFSEKLASGRILLSLPENAELHLRDWGVIEVKAFHNYKTHSDFIKQIEDTIKTLNDQPTRADVCREAFRKYLLQADERNYQNLKTAYEDLPIHQKVVMDYVDYKDPIVGLFERNESFTEKERMDLFNAYFE
ncbi:hypothetical protein [Flavobacterium sp.]|uniref:DUF7638 domain-containing protein n=1 Tax=Flavobacterium sp. TaxID=239 RepID=UPI0039E2AE78